MVLIVVVMDELIYVNGSIFCVFLVVVVSFNFEFDVFKF